MIFLCLPFTSSAQNASTAVTPDLLLVDYKLGPFRRIDVSGPPAAPTGESPADPLTKAQSSVTRDKDSPPRYETKLKPEIKVRNTGARIVKSIDCEFLLSTVGPTHEVRAFTMHFSKVLRPGATVRFSQQMKADHLVTWKQRQKEGSMSVRASIIRVEYNDGTVWERGPLRYP
jgi:hypothetical protein